MKEFRFARWLAIGLAAAAMIPSVARADALFDIAPGAKFSAEKLSRIGDFFRAEIAAKKIPGAIVLIRQRGKPVYSEFFGVRDVKTGAPMTPDTIFRLHSMTKPLTSVAAMMLVDDGLLSLDDPVGKFIPAFGNSKVGVERKAENGDTIIAFEPLKRPLTVRDLMLHTAGTTYGFYGDNLARKAVGAANIYAGDFDNAEFAERLARLPLAEQPGTLWDYGHATDVLGRVIEIASKRSLLAFERERLLGPLRMTDTAFFVTNAEAQKRIANPMPDDADFKVGFESQPDLFKKWESGGGGMVSTAADFANFLQMTLDGGSFEGRRLMKPETFTQMTSDHIGPASGVARDYYYFPGDGFGFGLGFGVRTDAGTIKPPAPGSLGELKWDGASGCYFIVDRRQEFFVLLLQQTPSHRQRIQQALKQLVYEALEK